MDHNLKSTGSVEINAALSKVWEALTNPEVIKKYLFGTNTITDWKSGSEIIFQGEYEGQSYKDMGRILEIIPEQLLKYSYWSGFFGVENKPENYSIVTCAVKNEGGNKSILTWTMQGFIDADRKKHSDNGMEKFLNGIKDIVENL